MSDKSKLGFNINPKNYDELNSTDNLITSGSDSGWLGKKLQGDDSNDLDLSKINPLFDKDLYEKYRPGVNTNDGSVNQDIWGYKCFNSPVSFRNGIYGDTYSIKSIEGIEDSIIHKFTYNGVSTSVNDKSHVADKDARDNVRYSYNLTKELLTVQEKSYIASTYTGKLRRALSSAVRPTYDLFEKEPRVYGSSIENETSVSGDVRSDCFWLYTYCNPVKTKLNIYNGINAYSSNAPTQYINERNEINIASTIFNDDNTDTTKDIEHAYSESRVTVGTNCKEDIVIKDYTSASGNCIRMYSTNGRYRNTEYINDNISSIIITPEIINTSIDNKIIAIDYHTSKLTGDDYNYSIPLIDVTFDYTKVTDDPANLIFFQINSLLNIQDATTSNTEGFAPSINVYGIFKNANSDIIKYRGTQITPTSITVNAIQFNQLTVGETFISNIHNKLVPVEYIFKQNDNDETGINTYGLKLLGCDSKFKTSFICDYLEVSKSIKCSNIVGIASAAEKLVYVNPTNNAETELLTVSNENLILPRGNKEISIGNNDHRLNSVYAENFYGTATKAERDGNNNIITDTYFKLDYNNSITGLNYIIGAGEHIRFTDAYSGSARTFTSIATSYADNYHEYCTNLRWSNNDETAFIVCGLKLQISYDPNSDSGEFQILPHVYTDSTSQDITMRMVLGSKDEPLSSIYCNEFPTLYKTIACNQFNTNNTPYYGTSIGNIRLLCIVLPPGGPNIDEIIYPGYKFTGMFILGKNTYHARLARFNVNSPNNLNNSLNNLVAILPVDENDVDGTWVALSGADVNPSIRDDEMYVPILAMRVE